MRADANPARSALDQLIARLHDGRRLRVWSLVITLFGDAVVPRGGRIGLGAIQEIMGRLGIEAGAVRTAMSRLAADRWVVREKVGRHSFFMLDEQGRHAFDLAARRIYAGSPPAWNGAWTVAIAPPGADGGRSEQLRQLGFVPVNASVHLRADAVDMPDPEGRLDGMLVIHGESAEHPEELRKLWPSDELAGAYKALIAAYAPLLKSLGQNELMPIEAVAARTLLIHDWRRVVLRDPGLPAALLPKDWPGDEARALARDLFRRLLPRSEAWLDAAGLPPPQDPELLSRRFPDDRYSSSSGASGPSASSESR